MKHFHDEEPEDITPLQFFLLVLLAIATLALGMMWVDSQWT